MDGRDRPAVQLCHVAQMRHVGEVAAGDGHRRFLDLTGPYRLDAAAYSRQREHADPVKQGAQPKLHHLICGPAP